MNKLSLWILIMLLVSACVNKNEKQAQNSGQEIYFEQSTYDYGQIEEDSDGLYIISFKNIGQEAIVINKVRSSCGCTIPSWPHEPVKPGASGRIEVKYNTSLVGSFMKSVYVYSSAANSPVKLTVKGKVVAKTEAEKKDQPEEVDKLN